ncbi:hypothetical protein YC2023_111345 [Brassica napus]
MEPPFLSLKTMEHIRSGSLHPDTDEVSKAYIQTIVPSLSPQGKGWGNICRVFSQNNQSVLLDNFYDSLLTTITVKEGAKIVKADTWL